MQKNSKIFIAGHKGTLGSAIYSRLKNLGFHNLIVKTHQELDLMDQKAVASFFEEQKPEFVFFAAAKLAHLGSFEPASVFYANLAMQNNIFYQAYLHKVKKLVYFGSAWAYPKEALNPIKEEALLQSDLDYIATPYALSKIVGIKMCEAYNIEHKTNFLSLVLANLYGETKDFDFETAKVLPAILRKIHLAKILSQKDYESVLKDVKMSDINEAKNYLKKYGVSEDKVEIWGSGKVKREFIYSTDLADACIFIMQNVNFSDLYEKDDKFIKNTHINVGTGEEVSIKELAQLIAKIVGFKGELFFDTTKPDSSMNRLLDSSKLEKLGFKAQISLEEGITKMYEWYLKQNTIRQG